MRVRSTETISLEPDTGRRSSCDRPTVASISLQALTHNFQQVLGRSRGRKILAAVKGRAYGHGLVPVSRHLVRAGVSMLGVALVEEGRELREAGIDAPVLIMGPLFPDQAEAIATSSLTPVLSDRAMAEAVNTAARRQGRRIPVHIEIDTGMGRMGIRPSDVLDLITAVQSLDSLWLEGLMTHFADADMKDKRFASGQMDLFESILETLSSCCMLPPLRHAANSAAVLDYNRALFTMIRPGIMLYGYDPLEGGEAHNDLRPVLTMSTRIAFLKKTGSGVPISYGRTFVTRRESVIATIPVGYADGFSRGLSNCGQALVRGVRVPVAGRVCMDATMLDVTDVPGVSAGDEVVLIGRSGNETITAEEIAARTGTISYEVLCGISGRVPRVYI